MFDANQSLAEDLLRKGEIDLAITELSGRTGLSIQSCNLLRVPLVLVVPKKTPWKSSDAIFQRRHSISLLALPPDEAIMKNFQAGLKKLKLGWSPAVELSSLELVETYVALGFGRRRLAWHAPAKNPPRSARSAFAEISPLNNRRSLAGAAFATR